jgi:hypothetical protein
MNKTNLNKLIENLEKYDQRVKLTCWQMTQLDIGFADESTHAEELGSLNDNNCRNLKDFHVCGNTACVGGVVAMMPEFKEMGGSQDIVGAPIVKALSLSGVDAVAYFLNVIGLAYHTIYLNVIVHGDLPSQSDAICNWRKWRGMEAAQALRIFERYNDEDIVDVVHLYRYIDELNNIDVRNI